MPEPRITINGITVTDAMAMTLRCAVASFAMSLREEGLGEDEHGKRMTKLYLKRIRELDALCGLSRKRDCDED